MEGWHGWDEYAPFYDWENARTLDRRDVTFWERVAHRTGGQVLELGCGTGRVSVRLARHARAFVGVDRSAAMIARARLRFRRARAAVRNSPLTPTCMSGEGSGRSPVAFARADIRALPFDRARFDLVVAPYGVLQSLLSDEDLADALRSIGTVLRPGGSLGIDLVPDVPRWREYHRQLRLRGRNGRRGTPVRLIESVTQDRRRQITIFDQEFVEGRGASRLVHRFSIAFRTVPVPEMCCRLERAGFRIDRVLGDYDGRPWDQHAETWILLARRDDSPR